jgi:hypothetical protein
MWEKGIPLEQYGRSNLGAGDTLSIKLSEPYKSYYTAADGTVSFQWRSGIHVVTCEGGCAMVVGKSSSAATTAKVSSFAAYSDYDIRVIPFK